MPRKKRGGKLRIDPNAEAQAWTMVFESGYDFFGDLKAFGINSDDDARNNAREAWRRLGALYLASRDPECNRERPWAIDEFGEPPCR